MEYVRVADKSELPTNKMIIVVVGGKEVLLANVEGSYYAIANTCTHAGGSLAKGSIDGSIVTCPRHGARFNLMTGKAVREAKIGFIKIKVKDEASYTVKVEGTDILVEYPKKKMMVRSAYIDQIDLCTRIVFKLYVRVGINTAQNRSPSHPAQ